MIAVWNSWLKILLAAGLIMGCNSLVPGLAAASTPTISNESCHHPDTKSGGNDMACKYSCLAIAPIATEVHAELPTDVDMDPLRPDRLTAVESAPATPPPRSSEHADFSIFRS